MVDGGFDYFVGEPSISSALMCEATGRGEGQLLARLAYNVVLSHVKGRRSVMSRLVPSMPLSCVASAALSVEWCPHFGRYCYTAAGNPNSTTLVPFSHSGPTTSR